MQNKIRLVLFDDNKRMRDSLALLFKGAYDFELVGTFSSCSHVIEDIQHSKPDVVLMDIDMPGVNGIEAVKKIRKPFPALAILMLTGFEDDDKVFASICAGANGYILKNAQPAQLLNYAMEVFHGGAPMTPVIARKVLQMFARSNTPVPDKYEYNLSVREKDVLELLVKGKSYKMIAAELSISYETVHSHIKKIYEKLHVNSVAEAVSKTLSQKLLNRLQCLL